MNSTNEEPSDNSPAGPVYEENHHLLGTGIGAVGGALTGAAVGAIAGPVGVVAGAVAGGAFGAVAGAAYSLGVDPEVETSYWHDRYRNEPYYRDEYAFEDYGPAYQLGWQLYSPNVSFEMAEKAMSEEWAKNRGASRLEWDHAREAA
ncbi:MAG: hypothetical protein EOP85_06240, partial [Verrucomicrobiaceae bacterium]